MTRASSICSSCEDAADSRRSRPASDVIGVMESVSWEAFLMDSAGARAEKDKLERTEQDIDTAVTAARDRLRVARPRSGNSEVFETGQERTEIDGTVRRSSLRAACAEQRRRFVGVDRVRRTWRVTPRPGATGDRCTTGAEARCSKGYRGGDLDQTTAAGAKDVELLGAQHPLVAACGVAARAAIYDGSSPFAAYRLSAKIADIPCAGILYTLAARYAQGDGKTYAEEIIPVFALRGMYAGRRTPMRTINSSLRPVRRALVPGSSSVVTGLLTLIDERGLRRGEAPRSRTSPCRTSHRRRTTPCCHDARGTWALGSREARVARASVGPSSIADDAGP